MAFGIPNIEREVSNFLESGKGITQVRSVEWEKKYLWIVDFVDSKPPAPFEDFFPANDVTIPMGTLEHHQIDLPQHVFFFPIRATTGEISITFYDDDKRTLLKWFTDWIHLDINNYGLFVSGLGDNHKSVAPDSFGNVRNVQPVRKIRLALLDAGRKTTAVHNFWVIPDGEIAYNGAQISDAQTYTMSFKIVNSSLDSVSTKEKIPEPTLTEALKSVIGRFI